MTWWQAIILGIVEGLTEYLPVSSTGHLLVVQALLGIGTESAQANAAANAYAICIQAGAILAVLGLYWKRVKQCSAGWAGKVGVGPGDETGFRIGLNMLVAFMPAAVVGLLLDDWIEDKLFGPWPIVIAWFVGGIAILATVWWKKRKGGDDHAGKDLSAMTVRMALTVGLIQCLAMWPGTSRSLVTIVGGVLVGMSLASAVEFSFLLGVVTLCAATVYKAVLDTAVVMVNGEPTEVLLVTLMIQEYGWVNMLIGSVAAWASAVAAVTWMVAYLKKHGMEIFGYYRIAIAVVVAGLLLGEVLKTSTS
ncbi:MAG: undecaprenyl-diphosphate phosphatase [Planctomycetota bacterium]